MYGHILLVWLLLVISNLNAFCSWLGNTLHALTDDVICINKEFLSIDTLKVFTAAVPFYLLAAQADRSLHRCFYDRCCHKNINQSPQWWYKTLNMFNDISVLLYSSFSLIAPDEDLRRAGRIFGVGFLSAMAVKDLVKNIHMCAAIRPFNEHFCPKKTYGGFPSGHMAQACYLATILGIEYGLKAAIPLSLGAGCMFISLINSNRHYASQVIAGAALGIAYGIAVYKVIAYHNQSIECTVHYESNCLHMGLRYRF